MQERKTNFFLYTRFKSQYEGTSGLASRCSAPSCREINLNSCRLPRFILQLEYVATVATAYVAATVATAIIVGAILSHAFLIFQKKVNILRMAAYCTGVPYIYHKSMIR